MFFKPNPLRVAEEELAEAELSLMRSHTAAEYAQSQVQYNTQRVERLTATIKERRNRYCPTTPPGPPPPPQQ